MIGTIPETGSVPLEYRYALDAAVACCGGLSPRVTLSGVPSLDAEAIQRFPAVSVEEGRALVWIEPSAKTWKSQLSALTAGSKPGAVLVVVASRPLAALLPERRGWPGDSLGPHPGGIARLLRALRASGFEILENHGIHPLRAIVLSRLSACCERVGRPDLGDRHHFAARRAYRVEGALAPLATVGLLVARKWTGS